MKIKIAISVIAGDERYLIESGLDLDPEEFNIDSAISDCLSVAEMKMQQALNPCYYDHQKIKGSPSCQ